MSRPILVTGAASGLGLELTRALLSRGRAVIMGSRDLERGRRTAETLRKRHPDASIDVLELDLASLASISRAVETVRESAVDGLDGIACNAAIQVVSGVQTSADGHELTFATNHLGHFALVTGLLGAVVDGGRIAVVSSGTHAGPEQAFGFPGPVWRAPRELADPELADPAPNAGRSRYATSKLANLYFAYELAAREPRLRVTAFDPGLMPATGLSRDYPPLARTAYRALAPVISTLVPGTSSPRRAAERLADLMTDPGFADVTGAYVVGRRIAQSSPESYNRSRAAELWRESVDLVESRV
jgi:protochlorophyllide reductase